VGDAEYDAKVEETQEAIEDAIGVRDAAGEFVMSQAQSVEFLRDVARWCRDRALGIEEEVSRG